MGPLDECSWRRTNGRTARSGSWSGENGSCVGWKLPSKTAVLGWGMGSSLTSIFYRIHGTGIFPYIYHTNQRNVGKYTSFMDPMGMYPYSLYRCMRISPGFRYLKFWLIDLIGWLGGRSMSGVWVVFCWRDVFFKDPTGLHPYGK